MRDERRPGLDGPGRMVKSRGLDGKISYLTKIWGFIVIEFWYKIAFTWIAANSGIRISLRVRFTLTRRTGGGKR